jgi:phospholipase/carboxylesterase
MTEIPPLDDRAVLWSAPEGERAGRPLLVLLHGHGSDEHDLFGLARHLPGAYVVASVRAPLAPPFPTPGWSWFPTGEDNIGDAQAPTRAAQRLLDWIEEATDAETVGMLGFSQGGAISLQALRLAPERFAFGVNLAGFVAPGPLPTDAALAKRRPPVFWGRGALDEVISPARIAHTVQWLPEHVELSGRVYPGLAHGISQDELDDVVTFLAKQLDD